MSSTENKKILIGNSRITDVDGWARLVCDITINGESREMFFGVRPEYRDYLTIGRADPFLAVLLNYGMRTGRDIVCRTPVSEDLLFRIRRLYIKALAFGNETFKEITIEAPIVSEPYRSQGAIGSAMSFGCDSMYTFFKHRKNCEYTVTHICNFNNGVYFDRKSFDDHTDMVRVYAEKNGIKSVSVDTNIFELMPERFLDVYSQRNIACVLALQGLFGIFLYSSGHDEEHVAISTENSAGYDIITTEAFSTKNLRFILSGCECSRVEKLRVLCDFDDARYLLHPCYKNPIGEMNCGRCRKDIREMILFYAWGVTEKFKAIYDFSDFERKLPINLGILLSLSDDHLYREVLEEYVKSGKTIPKQSYAYAQAYKKAMKKA